MLKDQYFSVVNVRASHRRSGRMSLDLALLKKSPVGDRRLSDAGTQSYLVAAVDAVLPGPATVT